MPKNGCKVTAERGVWQTCGMPQLKCSGRCKEFPQVLGSSRIMLACARVLGLQLTETGRVWGCQGHSRLQDPEQPQIVDMARNARLLNTQAQVAAKLQGKHTYLIHSDIVVTRLVRNA